MAQRWLPAVYMRGGTSRALFFNRADLPPPGAGGDTAAWDAIFRAALGSPDPNRRQLDGMGGGITSLSKIAVIGPPTREGADVDYTFAQVDVTTTAVGYRGNCGNISSAVGPYAVNEGLVVPDGPAADVVIHNTNTGKLIRARFACADAEAAVEGDMALDGVAGTGAPVELSFLDPAGAATGKLFPTGRRVDTLVLPDGASVAATLLDVCNPVAFVPAEAFGLTLSESADALAADAGLLARLEAVRAAAAHAMGMVADPRDAYTLLRNLPLVAIVGPPADGRAHVATRMISSGQPHKASPLTGGMCLAAAALLPGTLVHAVSRPAEAGAPLTIAHASGLLDVSARGDFTAAAPTVEEAAVFRTARRLMSGRVYF